MRIWPREVGQSLEFCAVGPYAIDFVVAVALARERDPVATGRPAWESVVARPRFESASGFRGDIKNPQTAGRSIDGSIDDLSAVRRPARHARVSRFWGQWRQFGAVR